MGRRHAALAQDWNVDGRPRRDRTAEQCAHGNHLQHSAVVLQRARGGEVAGEVDLDVRLARAHLHRALRRLRRHGDHRQGGLLPTDRDGDRLHDLLVEDELDAGRDRRLARGHVQDHGGQARVVSRVVPEIGGQRLARVHDGQHVVAFGKVEVVFGHRGVVADQAFPQVDRSPVTDLSLGHWSL